MAPALLWHWHTGCDRRAGVLVPVPPLSLTGSSGLGFVTAELCPCPAKGHGWLPSVRTPRCDSRAVAQGFGARWGFGDCCSPPGLGGGSAWGSAPVLRRFLGPKCSNPTVALGPGGHSAALPGGLWGRARGSLQCGLPTAELGELRAPNPLGETPPNRERSQRNVLPQEGWNSRLAVPSHTRGGPGFCPSLRWPRCTPALLQNLPLSPHRRLSPLPPSILPHGDPTAGVTSTGTTQPMGEPPLLLQAEPNPASRSIPPPSRQCPGWPRRRGSDAPGSGHSVSPFWGCAPLLPAQHRRGHRSLVQRRSRGRGLPAPSP